MTNKKTTKRALLMSVMSMLICIVMLMGTTFAWFTDSVTSGRNTIAAGNLDVTLDYWNATDKVFKPVETTTSLFNDAALWEPGHTEVAYLKVGNAGSLALKYRLAVNVYDEVSGTNVYGEEFNLSEHLVFKVIDIKADEVGTYTRETAIAAAGDVKGLTAYLGEFRSLETKDDADYVALVVYMPTTVGNEANYKTGTVAPSVEMGVELVATQLTYESDSFDELYDDNAFYYDALVADAAGLAAAISAGDKVIAIDGNIALTSALRASGVTFIGLEGAAIDFGTYGIAGSDITYKNLTLDNVRDGWYNGMEYGNALNNTYIDCVIANGVTTYGNSTFKNCTFSELPTGNYALFAYAGSTITVDGCTFNYSDRAIKIYNEGYTPNVNMIVKNTAFKASDTTVANKAMIEIDDSLINSVNVTVSDITVDKAIAAQGIYRIDDGALDTSTAKSVVSVNGVVTSVKAASQAELADAVNSSDNVAVELADGTYSLSSMSNKDVTISGTEDTVITVNKPNLSGTDISFEGVTVQGSGYATGVQHVNTVEYNNVTIKGEMCLYGEKVVFTNCDFELTGGQYLWTYGAKQVVFDGCTFNTDGKAILVYNESANLVCDVTVTNCTFNATASAYAGTISNQACAAIEIGSNLATNGHYTVTTSGNTVDSDFSGEWRVKASSGANATVNGTDYTAVTLDGAHYTLAGTTVTKD